MMGQPLPFQAAVGTMQPCRQARPENCCKLICALWKGALLVLTVLLVGGLRTLSFHDIAAASAAKEASQAPHLIALLQNASGAIVLPQALPLSPVEDGQL
jgi:hypothetical protein